jgi:diguanylate cyclase (GGDEF)-like protein
MARADKILPAEVFVRYRADSLAMIPSNSAQAPELEADFAASPLPLESPIPDETPVPASPKAVAFPDNASVSYALADVPMNEADRAETLASYRILDTGREQAYDDLTNLAAAVCGTPMAMLTFLSDRRQWFKSSFGFTNGQQQTSRDISFCSHAILHPDEIMEVTNTLEDPRFAGNPMVQSEPRIRYYAGVPLLSPEGHALGTLCVLDDKPNRLDERRRNALLTLARQASAQLELRRAIACLEAQSLTDPLTGTFNRRAFDRLLQDEWTRHERQNSPLSVLRLDVDLFGAFVEQYGRPAGDAALKQLIQAIRQPLRPSDIVARYGADSLAVVIQNSSAETAVNVAESLRISVEQERWTNGSLTVSVGVATMQPSAETDRRTLMARADHALYTAKREGRNRVCHFHRWSASPEGRAAIRQFMPYVAIPA